MKLEIAMRPSLAAQLMWLFAALALGTSAAHAQTSSGRTGRESTEIRNSAEEILSSPEFRYFKRLERGAGPPGSGSMGQPGSGGSGSRGSGSRGSGSSGSGSGGNSSSRSGSNGNSNGGSNTGSSNSPRSSSASGNNSTSMPTFGPSFGAMAGLGVLFKLIAFLMLIVVVAIVGYLIYLAIMNFDGSPSATALGDAGIAQGDVEPESPPGEIPCDVYLAEARKLAAAGQYREAIARLLLGAMSYAERAGLIRYRRGLTQRDYLRTMRRQKSQYNAMKTMVRLYEPLGFGRRTPERRHFEESVAGYEQSFNSPGTTNG